MAKTVGYVGTVRINDEGAGSRVWVSLTKSATGADWLEYADLFT